MRDCNRIQREHSGRPDTGACFRLESKAAERLCNPLSIRRARASEFVLLVSAILADKSPSGTPANDLAINFSGLNKSIAWSGSQARYCADVSAFLSAR